MGEATRQELIAYCYDFMRGLGASLSGFPAVFHLDDQPVVPQQEQPAEVKPSIGVLKARRTGNLKISDANANVRLTKQKSIRLLFFCCTLINLLMVATILSLRWSISLLNHRGWTRFVCENILYAVSIFGFLVIKIASILWFGDISKGALNYRRIKNPKSEVPKTTISISDNVADLCYGITLEIVVLIVSQLAYSLPAGGPAQIIGFFITSQLNALYCFEYFWLTQGIKTKIRASKIENNWPYYTGFGCLLTIATTWFSDFILNGMIFAALFPIFIVSSYMAHTPSNQYKRMSFPLFELTAVITNKVFMLFTTKIYRILGAAI